MLEKGITYLQSRRLLEQNVYGLLPVEELVCGAVQVCGNLGENLIVCGAAADAAYIAPRRHTKFKL